MLKKTQQHRHFKTTANVLILKQINFFFDTGLSQSSERTSARYYSARETESESAASHSVGRWSAHLRSECETHVNVWVGVKRIEERVSVSQYENAHVCPSAGTFNKACTPTELFFPHSPASLFLQPHAFLISDCFVRVFNFSVCPGVVLNACLMHLQPHARYSSDRRKNT